VCTQQRDNHWRTQPKLRPLDQFLQLALWVDLTQLFLFNEKMGKCEHTNVFSAILPSIVWQYLGQVSCVTGNEQTLCVVVMETSHQGGGKRTIGQLSYQQHYGYKIQHEGQAT
jgi:hypothetical protein